MVATHPTKTSEGNEDQKKTVVDPCKKEEEEGPGTWDLGLGVDLGGGGQERRTYLGCGLRKSWLGVRWQATAVETSS